MKRLGYWIVGALVMAALVTLLVACVGATILAVATALIHPEWGAALLLVLAVIAGIAAGEKRYRDRRDG